MTLIDSHCHLGHIPAGDEAALAAAADAGVDAVIDIGMGTRDSALAAERAARHPGRVFASAGLHPNDLAEFRDDAGAAMRRIEELLTLPGMVAVGETGLDRYRDREAPDVQEAAFEAHIDLARRLDRTLVIHCRDSQRRVLEILEEAGPPERVVMHCFSGDPAHARACGDRGYFVSFAGNVTYKRNDDLRAAVHAVPGDLLLVETDAPYLAPHPHRGKDNSPALLPLTAAALAAELGADAEQLAGRLTANTRRAFALAP